jgi:predicted MPP superfamily phosphohydrolase
MCGSFFEIIMNLKLSRRDFLRIIKYLGPPALVSALVSYYGFEVETGWIDVSQVEIPLTRLAKTFDGFRILQISDIHMGGWMNRQRLAIVLDLVRKQTPDLIVMTGDFVIGHSWTHSLDVAAEELVTEISALAADYKIIGVMGNHDYWTDPIKVRETLARCGILELKNDIHMIVKNGESLCIAGVDDVSEGEDRISEFYDKLPLNTDSILLAHEPDYADTAFTANRFGLQLSGHSHGGQVVIPFLGPPVLPFWAKKYPSGLYRIGEMWLYTNRGVGMTWPFVRFNCRPEITVFTLKSL